jgi:hypothetical protein
VGREKSDLSRSRLVKESRQEEDSEKRSSARRGFLQKLRHAPILFAENAETLSRSHVCTPLRAPTPTTLSSVSMVRWGRFANNANRH